jgi:predicted ATPase
MLIARLRIINYKGFRDSGWINFGSSFNVVIGKNTSGKTALLEALRPADITSKPHRSIDFSPDKPLDPTSKVQVDVKTSGAELKDLFLVRGGEVFIPIERPEHAGDYVKQIFSLPELTWQLEANCGSGFRSRVAPSHGIFQYREGAGGAYAARMRASDDRQSVVPMGVVANETDNVTDLLNPGYARRVYVFKAERLNVGRTNLSPEPALAPNASNLAAALMVLMTGNPHRFEQFNRHVTSIFPSVKKISVVPVNNVLVEICVWIVDPKSERHDLAIKLEETGTGVGQVLAILYVAMTLPRSVIIIDEPNSFLHPGAAKKLIRILKEYEHQYIISTHSSELIAVCDPSTS